MDFCTTNWVLGGGAAADVIALKFRPLLKRIMALIIVLVAAKGSFAMDDGNMLPKGSTGASTPRVVQAARR